MNTQTESTGIPYAVPLSNLTRADATYVGAKAANLGELRRFGFPVPDGFAVTTEAFDQFIQANALDETYSSDAVANAQLPSEIDEALRVAAVKLNGAPLAVRSSGVAEDLEGASFAGQYETILDVRGYEALVDAVRQCWASAFSARVAAYKSHKGQIDKASMAVLVQILVNAEAAGVAFTANPVNGRRDEAVVSAVRGYPVQEDNVFFTQGVPLALGRYVMLELGERLVKKGVIETREDVCFLELEEARQAFKRGGTHSVKALVSRRKGERAWAEQHRGPASYGKQPPLPPLNALPPAARFEMTVVPWYMERALSTGRGRVQQAGENLIGIAASSGKYTGTVRVIMNEQEFYKLQPGDVLVCPATTPMWSVLFANVGALVTNTGGILSHPAIIAREYRVPAVVATGNATSLLKDGQLIIVNGDNGCVEIQS